jgi:hypothetical protein
MNFKDAAYIVLRDEKKPLTARIITDIALSRGFIKSEGKTPDRTMAAEIYRDMNAFGERSNFIKPGRGLFGLKEWDKLGNEVPEPNGNTTTVPVKIITKLRETQYKSGSPSEFEGAIKDAFTFLGFEGELIGGSGDTDVLLTANIGIESFKVTLDGKTSKSGRIIDRQIDWISLSDHKAKNKADYIVVIGPRFSGGNLQSRAHQYKVSLLITENLIELVESHSSFPFTLMELKDLFSGTGEVKTQLEDLLSQNHSRRNLLEQFQIIIEEMQALQDRLGYFTFDSLAGREKIEELDIDPKDIDYIISLLRLPFINGIVEKETSKFILALNIKDIANIFLQISRLLYHPIDDREEIIAPSSQIPTERIEGVSKKRKTGSKYFKWYIRNQSIVAEARVEKPYKHHCPIEHFDAILNSIIEAFQISDIVSADVIFSMLEGHNLAENRAFKGKPEDYKIRMALGILEIEGMTKWTGSKRPIEYTLGVSSEKTMKWWKGVQIKKRI